MRWLNFFRKAKILFLPLIRHFYIILLSFFLLIQTTRSAGHSFYLRRNLLLMKHSHFQSTISILLLLNLNPLEERLNRNKKGNYHS